MTTTTKKGKKQTKKEISRKKTKIKYINADFELLSKYDLSQFLILVFKTEILFINCRAILVKTFSTDE